MLESQRAYRFGKRPSFADFALWTGITTLRPIRCPVLLVNANPTRPSCVDPLYAGLGAEGDFEP